MATHPGLTGLLCRAEGLVLLIPQQCHQGQFLHKVKSLLVPLLVGRVRDTAVGLLLGTVDFALQGLSTCPLSLSVPCLPLRTRDLQPPRVAGVGRVFSGLILAKFSVVISPHSYPFTPKKLSDFSPSLKPNHVLIPTYCSISGRLFTLIWSTLKCFQESAY